MIYAPTTYEQTITNLEKLGLGQVRPYIANLRISLPGVDVESDDPTEWWAGKMTHIDRADRVKKIPLGRIESMADWTEASDHFESVIKAEGENAENFDPYEYRYILIVDDTFNGVNIIRTINILAYDKEEK